MRGPGFTNFQTVHLSFLLYLLPLMNKSFAILITLSLGWNTLLVEKSLLAKALKGTVVFCYEGVGLPHTPLYVGFFILTNRLKAIQSLIYLIPRYLLLGHN